jgi:hypothetical protein
VRWWLFRVAGFGLVNYTASLSRVFLIAKGAYRSTTPEEFSNIKKPAKKKRKYNKIKEHHNALIKKAKRMMTMGFEVGFSEQNFLIEAVLGAETIAEEQVLLQNYLGSTYVVLSMAVEHHVTIVQLHRRP